MGSKNNDEAPPPYFASFLDKFDKRMDDVDNSIQQLDVKMSERIHLFLIAFYTSKAIISSELDIVGQLGGGVGLYIKNQLNARILACSEPEFDNTPEYLIAEIACCDKKLLCAVVYRRPEGMYPKQFVDTLSNFMPPYMNVVVTVPSDATHRVSRRDIPPVHTWLDIFVTASPESIRSYEKSEAPFVVGHDLIELEYIFYKPPHLEKKIVVHLLKNVFRISLNHFCPRMTKLLS
ncbi:hypothetical protein QAD02_020768 [Eretmocerus hayati]|uniref:Uncharacterized protein n=1 Tax=Eretmocerus hayati TaxID=131215 RepID=A0ACC2PT45_9HYME|nr:hypothetical protein QAD02_020768 [Eretmocerus hayati]